MSFLFIICLVSLVDEFPKLLVSCFKYFDFLQMNKLIEYYQQLAQKEKVERDRKKLARRRNYMPLAFSVRTWSKEEFLIH